jgi:phosphomannomutase/phosphoglucomutase
MLKPTIFREYDIRGIAEVDLQSPDVEALGRGLGTYLLRQGARRLSVARDIRLSSRRLRDALVSGLLSAGIDVVDVGCVPTPLLYFSVQSLGLEAGVMITGSHNPPEYNGFKTMLGHGTIYGAQIQEIARIIREADFLSGHGTLTTADVEPAYVDEVTAQFHYARRIKVVFDAGNGVAGPTLHKMLARLNVEATELYFDMDGNFPNHHPDPTVEKNLGDLKAAVARTGADLGIAFDGDSDRIGAVDEHGTVVWGDILMLIYGREILTRKPGATFIGEVKCSQVMYDELNRLGANAIMYKTGHSLIKAKMKDEHAELAGEMSGHMFFADRYRGYDDALYAACRLIEIVAASTGGLSLQTAGLSKTVSTPELRVDCPDEVKFQVVDAVKRHFQALRPTVDVDGVRVLFEHGWGLVRGSNTQPILVLRFEADTPDHLAAYRQEVDAAVAAALQKNNPQA